MNKQIQTQHFYVMSDSVGETGEKLARSIQAQFPTARIVLHKNIFITNIETVDEILEEATKNNGIVLVTITNRELADHVVNVCSDRGILCYNLLQTFTDIIQERTGIKPTEIPGAQHELSPEYFNRIQAIEFTMNFDDGKDPKGILEADIVILGISRTGKTPLSMYLATNGYKVCNIPLIPENEPPKELFECEPNKIIGLTNDAPVVNQHRVIRMQKYGMGMKSRYASIERVQEELDFSNQLYRKLKCPVINVANRSIEESASIILDMLSLTKSY